MKVKEGISLELDGQRCFQLVSQIVQTLVACPQCCELVATDDFLDLLLHDLLYDLWIIKSLHCLFR